jgi:hypothetical protein
MKAKCIRADGNFGKFHDLVKGDIYEVARTTSPGTGLPVWGFVSKTTKMRVTGMLDRFQPLDEEAPITLPAQAVSQATPSQDISDWRAWQHKAPGECVCGIPKSQCDYHR